jgi:hypothetical protein
MLKTIQMPKSCTRKYRCVRPVTEIRIFRWFICKPKFKYGHFLDGLGMENVGIIYGHLEYLKDIWCM